MNSLFDTSLTSRYVLVFFLISGCTGASRSIHPIYLDTPKFVTGTPSIAFVSDTQSPLWFEKLWLQSDDNEHTTQQILDAIARDSSCVALFHLGDITGAGSDDEQWKKFDEKAVAIRNAKVPLYPVFGNHEYLFSEEDGKYNILLRFPFLTQQWYWKRIGSVAIILLNSNFSHLSKEELLHQQQWYEQKLDSLENDTTVSIVIVGCHHPPYTNSTIVEPSRDVQQQFVPPFLKSKKAKLFLSGHAHAFEHFKMDSKDFLVIGGGGGLLHPLLRGSDQRWQDQFVHKDRRSFFHYVRILSHPDNIDVEVIALTSTKEKFEKVYSLEIPYTQK